MQVVSGAVILNGLVFLTVWLFSEAFTGHFELQTLLHSILRTWHASILPGITAAQHSLRYWPGVLCLSSVTDPLSDFPFMLLHKVIITITTTTEWKGNYSNARKKSNINIFGCLTSHKEVKTPKSFGKTRNPQNSLTTKLRAFLHKK